MEKLEGRSIRKRGPPSADCKMKVLVAVLDRGPETHPNIRSDATQQEMRFVFIVCESDQTQARRPGARGAGLQPELGAKFALAMLFIFPMAGFAAAPGYPATIFVISDSSMPMRRAKDNAHGTIQYGESMSKGASVSVRL